MGPGRGFVRACERNRVSESECVLRTFWICFLQVSRLYRGTGRRTSPSTSRTAPPARPTPSTRPRIAKRGSAHTERERASGWRGGGPGLWMQRRRAGCQLVTEGSTLSGLVEVPCWRSGVSVTSLKVCVCLLWRKCCPSVTEVGFWF